MTPFVETVISYEQFPLLCLAWFSDWNNSSLPGALLRNFVRKCTPKLEKRCASESDLWISIVSRQIWKFNCQRTGAILTPLGIRKAVEQFLSEYQFYQQTEFNLLLLQKHPLSILSSTTADTGLHQFYLIVLISSVYW